MTQSETAASAHDFEQANPHFVSAIARASDSCRIVASRDIYDSKGAMLWGRDQQVSSSLQQRLLERKLREPLETCLRAEDGVTNIHLLEELNSLLDSGHAIAPLIVGYREELQNHVRNLPLHSAMQLLLTVGSQNRRSLFTHAVAGMALAGAMGLHAKFDRMNVRMTMLGGLLHDVGEMYVDPQYLDTSRPLSATCFRHVVTHPLIGAQLLRKLTDYPPALAKAIAEHHERLDGTGYPSRGIDRDMGQIGRLLAVVEATLGLCGALYAPLNRAGFALRLVPGEFDPQWAGFVARGASEAKQEFDGVQPGGAAEAQEKINLILGRMHAALKVATAVSEDRRAGKVARDICQRAAHRLMRLDVAARSTGFWNAAEASTPLESFEQATAASELNFRVDKIRLECLWSYPQLEPADEKAVAPLWEALHIACQDD